MESITLVKRTALIIAVIFLIFSFCSCQKRTIREDYRDSGFRTRISFCSLGMDIEAYLVAEPSSDGSHNLKLEVISPESLCGLTVCKIGDREYVKYEGITLSENSFSALLKYAEIAIPQGEIFIVSKAELNGDEVIFATAKRSDGQTYEIYLDPRSYIPKEIHLGDTSVIFSEFTRLYTK